MANTSIVTQEMLQDTLQNYHENLVYPFLNGATHTGCVPLGTILPYFGETAPTHFLICDGTEYAKADYPELAEHLLALTDPTPYEGSDANHFKVPDLRGEFLRGTGTNSHTNQGNGAGVGVHQDGTTTPDYWYTSLSDNRVVLTPENTGSQVKNDDYHKSSPSGRLSAFLDITPTKRNDTVTNQYYHYTTRPTNTSVLYCIAYKNIYIDLALDSFPLGISNPIDGQALVWNATEGRWKNAEIDTKHTYSTDEHVVGTWIDGKPLYEKTITVQLGTLTTDKVAVNEVYSFSTLSLNNIESMWLVESHTSTGTNGNITWGTNIPEYFIRTNINTSAQQIEVQTNRITLSGQSIVATVHYTKTTD